MKKLLILLLFVSFQTIAQNKRYKIKYKYKKYQKFDFEDIIIEGDMGSPGDLSIEPRYQRKFKNPLPYRKNFNLEMIKAVDRIK